jgi:hypothetical protein
MFIPPNRKTAQQATSDARAKTDRKTAPRRAVFVVCGAAAALLGGVLAPDRMYVWQHRKSPWELSQGRRVYYPKKNSNIIAIIIPTIFIAIPTY